MQKGLDMSNEFDIMQHTDEINELDKRGIKVDKVLKDGVIFNCETHPYQEETMPGQMRQELFGKIGNRHFYDAVRQKLIITKSNLSLNKKQ